MTVPWIELGGSVEIKCPQTGFYANVEFLTKPFYGGKRNKVTAEIYSPNEKKPFISIAGEWSGLMEAKWHDKNVNMRRITIYLVAMFWLYFFQLYIYYNSFMVRLLYLYSS